MIKVLSFCLLIVCQSFSQVVWFEDRLGDDELFGSGSKGFIPNLIKYGIGRLDDGGTTKQIAKVFCLPSRNSVGSGASRRPEGVTYIMEGIEGKKYDLLHEDSAEIVRGAPNAEIVRRNNGLGTLRITIPGTDPTRYRKTKVSLLT